LVYKLNSLNYNQFHNFNKHLVNYKKHIYLYYKGLYINLKQDYIKEYIHCRYEGLNNFNNLKYYILVNIHLK